MDRFNCNGIGWDCSTNHCREHRICTIFLESNVIQNIHADISDICRHHKLRFCTHVCRISMSKGTTYNCLKSNRLRFKSTTDSPQRCVVLFYGMAGRLALPCGRAGARPYRDSGPSWRARPNRADCPRQRSGGRAKTPDINLRQKRQTRGTSSGIWRLRPYAIHARIPKAPQLPILKLLQRSHTQHDCVSSDMRPGMWHQTFCRPLGCIRWTRVCDSAQVFSARRGRNAIAGGSPYGCDRNRRVSRIWIQRGLRLRSGA